MALRCFFGLLMSFLVLSGCATLRPPRVAPAAIYTVAPGDTLSGISERYAVPMTELVKLNGLQDSSLIYPGTKLKLPLDYLSRDLSNVKPVAVSELLNGAAVYAGRLAWPLDERGKLNSAFGRRWSSFHEGIDLPGPAGTPIYAAHDGVVVYSGDRMNGYGNMVVIQGEGFLTAYAHNRRNLVRVGERVRQRQKIAEIGRTGRATGPHLHFETRVKNTSGRYVAVNPLLFFAPGGLREGGRGVLASPLPAFLSN